MIFFKYISKYNFEKINFLFKIVLLGIIAKKSASFMSENLNSNNNQNEEFNLNTDDSDYLALLIRLKDIKSTIALLEKTIFK